MNKKLDQLASKEYATHYDRNMTYTVEWHEKLNIYTTNMKPMTSTRKITVPKTASF